MALLVGLCSLVYAPRAVASGPPAVRVAVAPVVIDGAAGDGFAASLDRAVRAGFEQHGLEVVRANIPRRGCPDAQCIVGALAQAGADLLVAPAVGMRERDYGIALYLYDRGGVVRNHVTATCEICTYGEAAVAIEAQADALAPEVVELSRNPYADREPETESGEGPARIRFASTPSGAIVKMDGRKVGVTPFELEVAPGLHDVTISKRGHVGSSKTVRAIRGTRKDLAFKLPESRERQTKLLRAVGWGLTIPGLVVLGGGAALLALHGRADKSDCEGDNVDPQGRCRYRYNTVAGGALLTGVGIAAVVAGLSTGLVAFARRHDRRKSDSQRFDDTVRIRPLLGPTRAGLEVRF